MTTWRKRWRRSQKPITILSLLSVVNFMFPSRVHAAGAVPPNGHGGRTVSAIAEVVEQQLNAPGGGLVLPTPRPVAAKRTVRILATAYSSSRDETDGDPFTTASGVKAGDGIVAANGYAFGTRVRFPDYSGDKVYVVQDRMHARYGKSRVDLWMPTKQSAKEFGVRSLRMEIL